MHTLARPPVCEAHLKRQVGSRAFTLIELLTVIAIIAILAGITFGVIKGVNERAAIGQAKAELAVLSQALEAYKLQYGDYPWTTDKEQFYKALKGEIGPKGNPIPNGGGRRLIETSRFSLYLPTVGATPDTDGVYLLDPWGRPYNYYYKNAGSPTTWKNQSYVLYSMGPTITATTGTTEPTGARPTTAGVVNYADPANLDNIYANRN